MTFSPAFIATMTGLILMIVAALVYFRLKRQKDWAGEVFEKTDRALALLDQEGNVRHTNPAFTKLLYLKSELDLPAPVDTLTPPTLAKQVLKACHEGVAEKARIPVLVHGRRMVVDMQVEPFEIVGTPWFLLQLDDVTELSQCRRESALNKRLLARLEEFLILTDAKNRIVWVNTAFSEATGYALQEVRGKTPANLLYGPETEAEAKTLIEEHLEAQRPLNTRLLSYNRHGMPFWLQLKITPFELSEQEKGFLYIGQNVTQQQELEEEVERLSNELKIKLELIKQLTHRDGLTQLANRNLLDEVLEREWGRARRHKLPLTAILIDIDAFNSWNVALGYRECDNILKLIARLLEQHIKRSTDVIARFGNDQFMALMPDTSPENAQLVYERFKEALKALNYTNELVPGGTLSVSAAIVCVIPTKDEQNPQKLIDLATNRLKEAKGKGRDQLVVDASRCKESPTHEADDMEQAPGTSETSADSPHQAD